MFVSNVFLMIHAGSACVYCESNWDPLIAFTQSYKCMSWMWAGVAKKLRPQLRCFANAGANFCSFYRLWNLPPPHSLFKLAIHFIIFQDISKDSESYSLYCIINLFKNNIQENSVSLCICQYIEILRYKFTV